MISLSYCWVYWECFQVFPIQYDVGCGFVLYAFYHFEVRSFYTYFHQCFFLSWRVAGFCQRLFLHLLRLPCDFHSWIYLCGVLHSLIYIYLLVPSLLLWDEGDLVMMYEFFFFLVLEIEPRTLPMLRMCATTELHSHPQLFIFIAEWDTICLSIHQLVDIWVYSCWLFRVHVFPFLLGKYLEK